MEGFSFSGRLPTTTTAAVAAAATQEQRRRQRQQLFHLPHKERL